MRFNLDQALLELQAKNPKAELTIHPRTSTEDPEIEAVVLLVKLPLIPFGGKKRWILLTLRTGQEDIDEEEFEAVKRALWLGSSD